MTRGFDPTADGTAQALPRWRDTRPIDWSPASGFRALALRPAVSLSVAVVLVLVVGIADYYSDARLSVLFVIPVALATWPCGRRAGIAIALLATVTWAGLFMLQPTHPADAFFWWDSSVLATTLLLFVELLSRPELRAIRRVRVEDEERAVGHLQ